MLLVRRCVCVREYYECSERGDCRLTLNRIINFVGQIGLGVILLFFPDDLRDYFCEATVRKCEKLSVYTHIYTHFHIHHHI